MLAFFNVSALTSNVIWYIYMYCVYLFIIYMLFVFSHVLYEYMTPINQVALLLSSVSDFVALMICP